MTPGQQQTAYRQFLRWHIQQERVAMRIVLARFSQMQQGLETALARTTPVAVLAMVDLLIQTDMHLAMLSAIYTSVGLSAAEREYQRFEPVAAKNALQPLMQKDRGNPDETESDTPAPAGGYNAPPVEFHHRLDKWRRRLLYVAGGDDTRSRTAVMAQKTRALVRDVLETAIQAGTAVVDIVAKLRDKVVDRSRALLIARTEVTRAAAIGADIAADETGVPLYKRWIANRDNRTRPDHAEMNDKAPVQASGLFTVGGVPMKYPGDPAGGAKQCINCRCYCRYDSLANLTS